MKECAADLSKAYGVTMVDGTPDGGRLQVVGDRRRQTEQRMTDETEAHDELEARTPAEGARRGLGGFAAGIVIGAVLGVGLGMLFAPERGEATRRRLRKRLARLRERAGGELETAGKRTRKELARRRRRLEEALERVRERGE
jgi:YtxH-like protein